MRKRKGAFIKKEVEKLKEKVKKLREENKKLKWMLSIDEVHSAYVHYIIRMGLDS